MKTEKKKRRVFLSFLGTSYYEETKYFFDNNKKGNIKKCRFIQEATVEHFCSSWKSPDSIYIFLTEGAKKINWIAEAQSTNKRGSYDGLSKKLKELNLGEGIINEVDVPNGNTESEIWDIFQKIYNVLQDGDEVYFDITHAFRSLPMLVMVLINYAKFLKNIKIKSITYGNYQAQEEGFSPVLDLTSFSVIQDWTNAVSDFVSNGKTKLLSDIITETAEGNTCRKEDALEKISKKEKNSLENFSNTLNELSREIATNRGENLYQGTYFTRIDEGLKGLKKRNKQQILEPIIDKIEEKLNQFDKNPNKNNGAVGVKWYYNHDSIQQAYTLGQEHIITLLCDHFSVDYRTRKIREHISNSLRNIYKFKGIDENNDLEKLISFKKIKEDPLVNKIVKDFNQLSNFRNTLNHAGMCGKETAEQIKKGFKSYYKIIEVIDKEMTKK